MLISADPVVQDAELSASVAGPRHASSAPKYLQLDYSSFLFLRPTYSCYRWHGGQWKGETLGLEVLYDEADMGRVYTHGVFICAEPELQGLGFNYLGSTVYMTVQLGVTRDRSHIETRYLFVLLPLLLTCARREHPQQYKLLISKLCHLLQAEPKSTIRYLVEQLSRRIDPVRDQQGRDLAMDMYAACQKLWHAGNSYATIFPVHEGQVSSATSYA